MALKGDPIVAGPTKDGQGASAFYNGKNYNYMDDLATLNNGTLTVSFWMY